MSNIARKSAGTSSIIAEICTIVTDITGVQLGERQSVMVQSRLKKRIAELHLQDEQEYFEYFLAHRASETKALISLLTTHHTYFFRESSHFDHMIDKAIPALVASVRKRPDKTLRIWSAACSKGQEVYSIAMLLAAHMPRIAPDLKYEIFGTDVDEASVQIGKNGVYNYNEIKEVPTSLAGGHWVRGTGDINNFVKAKASLKDHCSFAAANLLNFESVVTRDAFDIIFCRNVFIYFTSAQIKDISARLLKKLSTDGTLFIGISESLNGLNLPIDIIGPSIYQKKSEKIANAVKSVFSSPTQPTATSSVPAPSLAIVPAAPAMPNPLRVLCVDDSSSVLMLLKQILKKDQGFEVVGTAGNGLEAVQALKTLQADVMTLDIHMPEQDGLEYLKKNFGKSHPPVIMISSASREDGDLAIRCLESGASDYVEKPSLRNIAERGDEIRNKLRCAWRSKAFSSKKSISSVSTVDKSFATTITIKNPEKFIRVIVAGLADQSKLKDFFQGLKGMQPPTLILIDGAENAIPAFVKNIGSRFGSPLSLVETKLTAMLPGTIHVGSFHSLIDEAKASYGQRPTSLLVYGESTAAAKAKILQWNGAHLVVEDLGDGAVGNSLADVANDIVPHTSFPYLSMQFMSRKNG